MLNADLMKEVGAHAALNIPHKITAQNVDVIDFGQLVTEFFVFNCSIDIT
jgi:hypothetical protein